MRKKQLLLQNSALFAEIERKSGEIAALNIRLEELNESVDILKAENETLIKLLDSIKQQNELLSKENEALLAQQNAIICQKETVCLPDDTECDETTVTPLQTDCAEDSLLEESIPQTMQDNGKKDELSNKPLENTLHNNPISDHKKSEVSQADVSQEVSQLSKAEIDLLRTHGAQLIGKITRITAQMISSLDAGGDENSEALKNLALGKNESFKYKILSLINTNGEINDLKAQMDSLADETADYLESYKNK